MSSTPIEAVWLKRSLSNIPVGSDLSKGIKVLAHSKPAMTLASNESISRKNKHIDINFYYIRNATRNGYINLL